MGSTMVVLVVVCAAAGCGDDGGGGTRTDGGSDSNNGTDMQMGGGTVSAQAKFVKSAQVDQNTLWAPPHAADGRWTITPNIARATLRSLDLGGDNPQSVPLTNCTVEIDAADPTLAEVDTCDMQIPTGTYSTIGFSVSTTFEVRVSDAANAIYSTGTGLSSTAPGGGAQFTSYTIPGFGSPPTIGISQYLSTPWVVDADGETITVMSDTVHTVFANFSSNTGTIDAAPNPGVLLVPSPGGAGKIQLYSAETSSADNATLGGPTATDFGSVRLYFATASQPSYVFHVAGAFPSGAWAADPAMSPGTGTRAGGYLGLDSNNVVCWAVAQDYTWQQYVQVCRMQMRTNVGETTTVECQSMTSVPAPTSGSTYASGCPSITPTSTRNLTLIAN